jgi:hypothetical protein
MLQVTAARSIDRSRLRRICIIELFLDERTRDSHPAPVIFPIFIAM